MEETKRPEDLNAAAAEEDVLTVFAGELSTLAQNTRNVTSRQEASDETRFCDWDGQSDDGRKHREDLGEEAFPFEGAMDSRQRLADMTINERVAMLLVAASRSVARLRGMEANDMSLAARLNTLLKWLTTNQWGSEYLVEIIKGAQYTMGDAPGVCVWYACWEQERELAMQDITAKSLLTALKEALPEGTDLEGQVKLLSQCVTDPALEKDAVGILAALIPEAPERSLKVAVKSLRENGAARIPIPRVKTHLPRLKALRMWRDVFAPRDTRRGQKARWWLLREWLSKADLEDRIVSMGYRRSMVETIIEKHRGKSALETDEDTKNKKVTGDSALGTEQGLDDHTHEYEVLTAFWRACDQDGVPGIWTMAFNGHEKEQALTKIEVLDYEHGQYPFTPAPREVLGNYVFESRGIAELSVSAQASLKLFHDNKCDHVQLYTWPPVKRPRRAQRYALQYGPQAEWGEDRPGDTHVEPWPEPPRGLDEQQKEILRQHDMYFGRPNPEVPPTIAELHQQAMATMFLAFLRDALVQVVQLCQQFMTDDQVARVTGAAVPIGRGVDEIQGKFDLVLTFDPRELDTEFLTEMSGLIQQWTALDTESTIMRNELIRWLMESVNPALAERILRPVEEASRAEVEDEQKNFALIAAGVEPTMAEDGQNFNLRLNWLEGQAQKNPESVRKMSEDSKKILENRVKHLQFMVQQQRNAVIGKVGVAPVGE